MPVELSPAAKRPAVPGVSIECRVYERRPCELPSTCQPASAYGSKESRWSATIRNISLGGVNLNLQRRFEPGTGLAIELPGGAGTEAYTVLARVIHVKARPDGTWSLGCRFVSALGEDELQRMLPRPVAAKAPGRNTIANVLCQLEVRPGAFFSYHIKRLHVPAVWPLPAASIVTLRGHGKNGRWTLKLKIVRCRPKGEDWTISCRLLNPPSAENLLLALSTCASAQ